MSSQRPVDRRTVLGGVAVAGLAVVAVPALASGSSGSSAGGGSTTTTVKTSDVPVGGGVIEAATGVVVVQPTTGEFKAFSVDLPAPGLRGRRDRERRDHLPLPRQHLHGRATARSITGPRPRR